ncbi:MAG: hypothetical protein JNN30_17980 [Rhodanobacteraceae bacterium]|nr:hypothetical protein [Rhodanobacteraceae bacterium]
MNVIRRLIAVATFAVSISTPAAADYGFDNGFNPGYSIDAFAGSWAGQREGGKLARLPDGDIVVAGRVRLDGDPVAPLWNLGLVRYDANGQRRAWPGYTGVYGHYFSQYLVYPNAPTTGATAPFIERIDDIAHAHGRLFVLVTHRPTLASLERDVAVIVFTEDGTFVEQQAVANSGADETGVALDATSTRFVAAPVAVTALVNAEGDRLLVGRLKLNAQGDLIPDARFGYRGMSEVIVPGFYCGADRDCMLEGADLARPSNGIGNNAPTYIAASTRTGLDQWYPLVIKLDSLGALDGAFYRLDLGGLQLWGVQKVLFGPAHRPYSAKARALAVQRIPTVDPNSEGIWLTAEVSLECKPGIGVAQISSRGRLNSRFGAGGTAIVGGDQVVDYRCDGAAAHVPRDMTVTADIAIAGETWYYDYATTAWRADGLLLRMDPATGEVRTLDVLQQQENGIVAGDSSLRGIAAAPDGRYYVSGFGSHAGYGSLYLSARLRPLD